MKGLQKNQTNSLAQKIGGLLGVVFSSAIIILIISTCFATSAVIWKWALGL